MKRTIKSICLVLALGAMSACNTTFINPPGKSNQDFYNDANECQAMGQRVEGMTTGNIARNCMLGKGYTIKR